MKNIHIENSYKVWNKKKMRALIGEKCFVLYNVTEPEFILNRSYASMYTEWWLHNIAYYFTLPFCFISKIKALNARAKDVDLEEH
jgi:hypothetical protein